jgi:hypothetical protein
MGVGFDLHLVDDPRFAATRAILECFKPRLIYRQDRFDKSSTVRDRAGQVSACHVARFAARFARFLTASTPAPAAISVSTRLIR